MGRLRGRPTGLRRPDERGAGASPSRRDSVYRWAVALSPVYIVFANAEPVALTLIIRSLVVVLTPALVGTWLVLTGSRSLMGSHRNGWLTNSFMAALIVISIYVSGKNLWELWLRM
jgi:Mn2+/Fe2+ NRAMP family transporter